MRYIRTSSPNGKGELLEKAETIFEKQGKEKDAALEVEAKNDYLFNQYEGPSVNTYLFG